jgi:hypothetical protein
MADRKISDLTALTTPAAGDYLPIIDISEPLAANKNKRITIEELLRGAPDGTAAAPGIAFESDPDTGLYSTGANAVAISTGGTGRLFINSSGNVGIATSTTPGKATIGVGDGADDGLSLYYNGGGTNETVAEFHANTTTGQVTLGGTAATYFTTLFSGGSERLRITTAGQIQSAGLGSAASPALSFTTDTNTGIYSPGADQVAISTNGTGQLFVNSAGQVGIGTNGAQNKPLHIYSGANDSEIRLQTNSGTEQNAYLTLRNSGGNLDFYSVNGDIVLNPGNTAAAYFKASGRLGLGTSSPDRLLHVSAADTAYIRLENQDTTGSVDQYVGLIEFEGQDTGGSGVRAQIGGIYEGVSGATALVFGTSADAGSVTERLRINRNGNVGIGTTSPGAQCDIASSSTYGLRINHATLPLQSFTVNGTQAFTIGANSGGGGSFYYGTGNLTAATIDSSGRLLVGTSSARSNFFNTTNIAPTFQLEEAGTNTGFASFVSNRNDTGGSALLFGKTRGTTVGSNTIVSSGDDVGAIFFSGADGSELVNAASIGAQVDGTPGANDMPGRLVFSTTADGASSPTERLRITSAGVLQVADAGNIAVGTTTGTKIGTATTQKLGFYNATPVVQPAAVADATDAATVITQLNDLLAKLRTLGIIAT